MGKVTPTYNLEVLFPVIACQWHPTKNGDVSPKHLPPQSNKEFWWTCEFGHEWKAAVSSRHRANCPKCYKQSHYKKPNVKLKTSRISMELYEFQENYHEYLNLYINSTKKVKWKCSDCGDIWENTIRKRTAENQGCPYCGEKKVAPSKWNALSTKFPNLAKEWDFKKNKNGPDEELSGSHHKAWWTCSRGHSWQCEIRQRTVQKTSCRFCSYQISKPQKRIYSELCHVFNNSVELSYRLHRIEIDIYIPSLRLGIEYDGARFHHATQSVLRDTKKNDQLASLGVNLLRIRAVGLDEINGVPCIVEKSEDSIETIKDILRYMQCNFNVGEQIDAEIEEYLNRSEFINKSLYDDLLLNKKIPLREKSLAFTHPELAKEWSKNNLDSPEDVTYGTHKERLWICGDCKIEYSAQIYSRSTLNTGCGYCSGRYARSDYNLLTEHREIAAEFHPTKNSKTPEEVSPKSNEKYWWICKNGHEYEMIVGNRTDKGQGCKVCKNRVVSLSHNLAVKSPELAEWFDEELNQTSASQVMPNAARDAYWRCPNGHVWKRKVDHQVRGGLFCKECEEALGVSWRKTK
jgi:very-short-patch-repair endonuclease